MIPLVQLPLLVEQYGPDFADLFTPGQYGQFERYVSGLLVSSKQTVEAINRLFVLKPQNQSTLNRFLTESDYDIGQLNERRVDWMQNLAATRFKTGSAKQCGVLIVDDSLLHHVGQQIENIACLWDHAEERYVWAHNLVSFHYSDDMVDYPIDSQLWKPVQLEALESALLANEVRIREKQRRLKQTAPDKWRAYLVRLANKHQHIQAVQQVYSSKLTIAQNSIQAFFKRYPDLNLPLVFDAWYCVPWFCRWLSRTLKKAYVGAIKSDEKVFRKAHQFCRVDDFAAQLKEQHLANPKKELFKPTRFSFKGQEKTYYSYCKVHALKTFGSHRLTINYKKEDLSDKPRFYICNRHKWEAKTISRIYRHRWPVEVYHQEGKQEGLEAYQLRQFKAAQRHVVFIALVYSMLQRARFDASLKDMLHQKLNQEIQGTLAHWRRMLQAQAMIAILQWVNQAVLEGKDCQSLWNTITQAIAYAA